MGNRDLVRHGADHDARDDGDMKIRVHGARHSPGIIRMRDLVAATFGADIEVDPPHRDGADKCDEESAHACGR
jgi:hypothetical protein